MKELSFTKSKKQVLEYIKQKFPEFYEHEECLAAVTHWMHSPLDCPPLMPESVFQQLPECFFPNKKQKHILHDFAIMEEQIAYQPSFEFVVDNIPFPPPKDPQFTFIDLFAGIGGFRIAMQELGGKCIFSSEWDIQSKKTYFRNYGEYPYGDITKISEKEIPDHDILLAGFPCQAFSIAGYRHGFQDKKGRGNLFFDIYRILKEKRPKAFLLENVKNLQGHDNGNTFKVIKQHLEHAGYSVISKVMNSMEYGNLPQNRERIYIVGFRDERLWHRMTSSCTASFEWPEKTKLTKSIQDILEKEVDENYYYNQYACYHNLKQEITKRNTVYQWRRKYVRENKKGVCPTLTANMGAGGHNVPLILDSKDIRKLTPRECFRLQGFPDNFILPANMANSHLYMQAGNSVSVPVIERVAANMIQTMNEFGVI